nr:hypothetical protein CFP56_32174 [Quercus suber]
MGAETARCGHQAAQTFAPAAPAPAPEVSEPVSGESRAPDTESAPIPAPATEEAPTLSQQPIAEIASTPAEENVPALTPADAYSVDPAGSAIDEFAQTGAADDDLFDDFIPVDESMRIRSEDDLFSDDFTPAPEPIQEQPASRSDVGRGGGNRGRDRERGRGRGGQRAGHTAHASTQAQPRPAQAGPPENAPAGPRQELVRSVRGDRQATGGVKKPKLTEEELAEKMAQIQIKNASLTAAHARAEADAATFAQRESQAKIEAAKRQREERRDRQQMMGEREKNRMRKLKAMDGRQWDAEKNEDDFGKGGQFDKRAGFTPQDDRNDGREYLYKEPRGGGGGRGGGAARGGRKGKEAPQKAPTADEFPALPGGGGNGKGVELDAGPKTSWADQVEDAKS